ncbi:IclR family transcriptional regulator [Actinotalea sp. AC32]|nr:IclR family transcriptional regulator [Actinotalea sp. AC32]
MSAGRALAVLRVLAAAPGPLPAEAVAAQVGAPRASTYRLLRVMADEGFVVHFPEERRWGLGIATFEVGQAYLRRDPLERLARPVLLRLVRSLRRTAHLGVLHGAETLYLLVERPPTTAPFVTAVGVRLPAQVTASGRALLAHLPDAHVRALLGEELVRRGDRGPADVDALLAELATERAQGWSAEDGLVTPGRRSVAAAAFDATGRPAAAISVTTDDDDRTPRSDLVDGVLAAADDLTKRLGGKSPRD